jgi:hypothetical protein
MRIKPLVPVKEEYTAIAGKKCHEPDFIRDQSRQDRAR